MPDVSVVVPTRNRPDALRACLASLSGSTLVPGRLEVVVVDDGGSEPLGNALGAVTSMLDVHLLRVAHGGPGAARNAGVRAARGSVVAFTDDDCLVGPDWAERLHAAVAADPRVLAGGTTVNGLAGNPYASMSQRIVGAVYDWANADPRDCRFIASNNMAADRDAFLALGGFDERFRTAAEDRELCDRWRHAGRRIALVPAALVEHRNELDLSGFAAQHLRYGRGAYQYHRARRARCVASIRDEIGFMLEPRRWPWSKRSAAPAARARDAALVVLWQAANAAGFAAEAVRSALDRGRPA